MKKKAMELGLTSVTFRNLNYQEILDYCVKAGLSCIEWGSDVHVPETDPEHAREVKAATDAAGIRVSSYGSYYKLCANEDAEAAFRPYLETAVILGAPLIRLWSGSVDFEDATQEYYDRAVRETQTLCDMAAPYGIALAFEFHPKTLSNTGEHAVKLKEDICRENFGLYYQTDSRVSYEENLRYLDQVLPYLQMVHVAYYDGNWGRLYLDERDGMRLWTEIFGKVYGSAATPAFLVEFLRDTSLEGLLRQTAVMQQIVEKLEETDHD